MATRTDLGLAKLIGELAYLEDNAVRIGVLTGMASSDLEGQAAGDVKAEDKAQKIGPSGRREPGELTQGEVFAAHELGLGVPKRESLSWVMDNERDAIQKFAARVTKLVMQGKMTGANALGFMGENTIQLVQRRIRDRIPPELSDATIKRKTRADGAKADIPLIMFGQYIRSFRWNIVAGGTNGS